MGKLSKVLIVGAKNVGKTTILLRMIYDDETMEPFPTIEDIYSANIDTERGTKEKLQFYDISGLELPTQIPRQYLVWCDGYVLAYDTNNVKSLELLFTLKKDIDKNKDKKEVTIIVVGNQKQTKKSTILETNDKPHEEEIPTESIVNKASMWCEREKIRHYIVNAHARESLFDAFVYLASKLNPPATKTSFPQLSVSRKGIKLET